VSPAPDHAGGGLAPSVRRISACSSECPARAVRLPERFRGGCSFGAPVWRAGVSPTRGESDPMTVAAQLFTAPLCQGDGRVEALRLNRRQALGAANARALGNAQLRAGPTLSSGRELVAGRRGGRVRLGPLGWQLREAPFDLGDHSAHRDTKNTLTALDEVDDLIW
jgi:hypothetical protein